MIPPEKNLFSLYQIAAELMARDGQTQEAIKLLRQGIGVIPPEKNLFSLYQLLGEIHCRDGNVEEAIGSLREGYRRISSRFNGYKLIEAALYLCLASGAKHTLAEILAGTGADALDPPQAALGALLQHVLDGDWSAASQAAQAARLDLPQYFPLACYAALAELAGGDAEAAWQALSRFPSLTFSVGGSPGWLAAFIQLRRGDRNQAREALQTYLGRTLDESRELTETFLLRLWDQQVPSVNSQNVCFHFPLLPPALTGLAQPVRRAPNGPAVLSLAAAQSGPNAVKHEVAPSDTGSRHPGAVPEIYVSYAWGEDTTDAGRQREEIVDRLCAAVTTSGRLIGRDKERMRGGDSIDRFAQEISKAKRIIAVISHKSLRSEFCMAQELFRAFRRCDYQRLEFQEKVVALVMDDARPDLRNSSSINALAAEWQQRLEVMKQELQAVDPQRKSANQWIFVDLVDEMCPRLPDMLNALKDILMMRGFQSILDDGFREVLNLLPR